MNFDPQIVRQQIENLKLICPEAWDDGEETLLLDMLEAETDLQEFAAVIVDRMREASSMAGGIESRIIDLQARQGRYERREQAMRDLAFKLMTAADLPKLELKEATLSIRRGTPKVVITDEAMIPDAMCKFTRTPDRTKIKDALKSGAAVNGAVLSNPEPSLSVRVK